MREILSEIPETADVYFYPVLLVIYLFCLAHAVSIVQLESFSKFKDNCLILANVMTPFVFFLQCKISDSHGRECMIDCIQTAASTGLEHASYSRSLAAGVLFYWIIFLPFYKHLDARMKELQKES